MNSARRYNIVRAVLNGYPGTLKSWVDKDPKRFISAPMILKKDKHPVIGVATLRQELREGRSGALGEIISQYVGLEPNDPVFEPYWALAEELGVPTMIPHWNQFSRDAISRLSRVPAPPRKSTAAGRRSRQHPKLRLMDSARW